MLRICTRQVDFIDNRDNLQVVIQRQINIRQSLRFNALRSVNNQQRTLAGCQRTRNLIGEVDVAGSIDKVQHILLAIARLINAAYRLRLDGNASLTLQIHGVENLCLHLTFAQGSCIFNQAVCQRRFAMIYMGNNRKVTNMVLLNHSNVAFSFVDNNLLVLIIIPFSANACKLKRVPTAPA